MDRGRRAMKPRRTYWHLEGSGKKPSDYDIVTSKLLYYPARGFELDVPLTGWYAKYQTGSRLRCSDWELFRDPRETTYTKYTEIQKTQETFIDGLLRTIEETAYDANLGPAWIQTLDRVLAPLRFPVHGLQMLAAYIGH